MAAEAVLSWGRWRTRLTQKFQFSKVDFAGSQTFCGVTQTSVSLLCLNLQMSAYIRALKPISVPKHRREQGNDAVNHQELQQMQGLAGSLQWPAAQSMHPASGPCRRQYCPPSHSS